MSGGRYRNSGGLSCSNLEDVGVVDWPWLEETQ